jgi:hypothetical protein
VGSGSPAAEIPSEGRDIAALAEALSIPIFHIYEVMSIHYVKNIFYMK